MHCTLEELFLMPVLHVCPFTCSPSNHRSCPSFHFFKQNLHKIVQKVHGSGNRCAARRSPDLSAERTAWLPMSHSSATRAQSLESRWGGGRAAQHSTAQHAIASMGVDRLIFSLVSPLPNLENA